MAVTGAVLASAELPARAQMASSLGFHIILACFGIALPAVVLIAHWIGIRRDDPAALLLARRWSKVMTLLIAVGAVSGTVLSYEMGLLWPGLMGRFGAALGVPFSVEAVFFFVEAVSASIYLYGWRRLSPWVHWWTGVPMVVAGVAGALSVVAANSWMNQPDGITVRGGRLVDLDPWRVFFNGATPYEVPHMVLAAYMVTGFVVAGVYAVGLLRGRRDRYHRLGFAIPFWTGAVVAPFQVLVGHIAATEVATQQPQKFAAMELVDRTQRFAPEYLAGFYHQGEVSFGVRIPWLDSILIDFDPSTKVIGWNAVPPALRAPLPNLIHLTFDGMVVLGVGLLLLGAWHGWVWWFHRRLPRSRWFLPLASLAGLAAVGAMEMGWVVTEVGRQPWIVYGVLRTSDAVTPAAGVPVSLAVILALYLVLTAVSIAVPWLMGRRWRREPPAAEAREQVPYGPPVEQGSRR